MLKQRFVRYLSPIRAVHFGGQSDQTGISPGKGAQHVTHMLCLLCMRHQVSDFHPAAGILRPFTKLDHGQKSPAGDQLLFRGEAIVQPLRLTRQGAAHTADAAQGLCRWYPMRHAFPDALKRKLEQRQRSLAPIRFSYEQINRGRVQRRISVDGGLGNGIPQLRAAHGGHDDPLSGNEAIEVRVLLGLPEKIASQRQHHRQMLGAVRCGVQEIGDKLIALRGILAQRINFLKLIH